MTQYYRPLCQLGSHRTSAALSVAGGWSWFDHAEVFERGQPTKIIQIDEIPSKVLDAITCSRFPISNLTLDQPRLMGIINVTPDSFSDGGMFDQDKLAVTHGIKLEHSGADILDIGGESTRPGAELVPDQIEIYRIKPVIKGIREFSDVLISIDTRKSSVADAAIRFGANIVNDVSALKYDKDLASIVSQKNAPICLMHAQGDPSTMQASPTYDDVLLDVYDYLSERIEYAESKGFSRRDIIIDPGIGFGKTTKHCLRLIQNISLFHALGCPILLGVSRKRFIGELAEEPNPMRRLAGTVALGLQGISQGVQITRVHDIAEMRQALTLWQLATGDGQTR